MIFPEDVIELFMSADFDTLFNNFRLIKDENKLFREFYKKVKFGVILKFNINYYLKDLYNFKEKIGLIYINGSEFDIEDFWDEIELREDYMRRALYEYVNLPDSTLPRVD